MEFASIYDQGFVRVAACVPTVAIADPRANAAHVAELLRECADEGVGVAVFPELALTGYSIEDLLLQEAVLDEVEDAVADLVAASADLTTVCVVGAPLRHGNRLLNCAVVIHRGAVLGVAPKSYLPTYREFYERRHFAPGDDRRGSSTTLAGQVVPLGPDLLFTATDVPGLTFHVEVCEDLWVPVPPSAEAALAGANLLLNLSGSPITVGRAEDRRLLVRSQSARCLAAYVYTAAGPGESSTDLSWDGQTMVYELGQLLAETDRFPDGPRRAVADVDLLRLRQERLRQGTFDDNRRTLADRAGTFRTVAFTLDPPRTDLGLRRSLDRFPFVPDDVDRLALDCYEAYNIQVTALTQRLVAIGNPRIVIGVSGGLDSTHALMVAAKAMDRLGPPADRHPHLHDAGLRDERGDQGQRDAPVARARDDVRRARHPPGRGEDAPRHGPPVRRRAPRLRRHLRERPGRAPHRLPLPAGQPAQRHRARHRRPLRARPRAGARTGSATRCRTTRSTPACPRR